MSVGPSCLLAHKECRTGSLCLGCLTALNHQPLLRPNVHPMIQPLRRLPHVLRTGVTAELQKLSDAGITECVGASPSNLVLTRNLQGLCVHVLT